MSKKQPLVTNSEKTKIKGPTSPRLIVSMNGRKKCNKMLKKRYEDKIVPTSKWFNKI